MMQILLHQETTGNYEQAVLGPTGSNSTYCKKDLRGASLKNIEGEISLLRISRGNPVCVFTQKYFLFQKSGH